MTTTDSTHRNGVDTATLFATLDAVKEMPAAARFQFRAHNEWVAGTCSRSTISDFFGVGEERAHEREFVFDADHPAVLVGRDHGPTPVEFLLHALASCLTAGMANIAAARGVTLTEVRSTVRGDIDLNGIFGLQPVRNGYQQVEVSSSSRVTPPRRSFAPSSSSRVGARPSTTSSPTVCRSTSRSRSPDRDAPRTPPLAVRT